MKVFKFTLAALFLAAGCGTSAETERKLAELEQANAQKDSLMQEVALSTRLISDVSVELAQVQVRGNKLQVSSESPITASRDTMMAKLRYVVARVAESERQLGQNRSRIKRLTSISDSLRATLDSTMTNLQTVIVSQKTTIDFLTDQVNSLTAENVALKDSMATVYYVVGTRDELKKRGILVEQGGSRVLFVLWRTGRTLQPARNLDPTMFTAIDSRTVTEIPLPDPNGEYRVASLQDLSYVAEQRRHNKYIGTPVLTITSAVDFWRASKFLIIILEGSSGPVAEKPSPSSETQAANR